MTLREMFNKLGDGVTPHQPFHFSLDFSLKGFGFGQLYFSLNPEGKIHISNERMDRDTIKRILGVMVDQAVLADEPPVRADP